VPAGAGKSAGRVSVRVVPDSTGFRSELKAELDKIERDLRVQVKADLDDAGLKTQIAKLQQTKIDMQATVDTGRVREQISAVGKSGKKVEIPVSLSGANIVRAELIRLATNRVIDIALRVNKRSLLAVGGALASLSGAKGAVGYLQQIGSALGGLDKSIPKISAVALGIGSIGALGLSSVSGVLALASSLVTVAGAGVALPGILVGAGIAMGTLSVALSTAKTELAGLVPTLTKFQTAIGASFFKQAKGPIEDLVKTFGSGLLPAVRNVSATLGEFAAALARSVTTGIKAGLFTDLFKNVATAIDIAKAAVQPLVEAFGVLANVGADFLPALAQGFVNLSKQFGNFISKAAGDGSLDNWIQTGIAGLKSLGSVAGSVVGIVKGLFDAANNATGGNGLAVFADALKQVSAAVNSSGLQAALTTIFAGAAAGAAGLATAIKPIGSLLGSLAPALAGVFKTAGTVVGGALSAIAKALQSPAFAVGLTAFFDGISTGVAALLPVLPAIVGALSTIASTAGLVAAQLGPVLAASFAALAPVVSQVLTSLQPLIPILGAALASSVSILAAALSALAPVFSAIITAVSPLIPILAGALAGAITTLGPAITTIVQALGTGLAPAITAIAATVGVLAPVLAQVITSLAPLLPVILSLVPPLLQIATAVLPLIPAIIAQIVPLVMQLVPIIVQILASILPLVPAFMQLVLASTQLAVAIQGSVFAALGALAAILPSIVAGLQGLLGVVTAFVQGAVALFTGNFSAIPGIASRAISSLRAFVGSGLAGALAMIASFVASAVGKIVAFGSGIVSNITSAMGRFVSSISSGIGKAVSLVASLPGKARSALGNVGSLLFSAGADLVRGMIDGIRSAIGGLVAAAADMAKAALNAAKGALGIHSPSTVFRDEVGRHIPSGIVAGIKSGQSALDSAVGGMVNPNAVRLAAARVTQPTLAAGAGTSVDRSISIGQVTGTDHRALVRAIMTEMRLQDAMSAAQGWG
jgi:phage-related protein